MHELIVLVTQDNRRGRKKIPVSEKTGSQAQVARIDSRKVVEVSVATS